MRNLLIKSHQQLRFSPLSIIIEYLYVSNQRTVKTRNLQNGSKSTNHSKECDLLTQLNSIYLFSETSAMMIDGSETWNHWWWFEFQILHLIEKRNQVYIAYWVMRYCLKVARKTRETGNDHNFMIITSSFLIWFKLISCCWGAYHIQG